MTPEVLAIIPARGGSKGIPRKNLALLGGHPLVAWAIASALAAKCVTRTVVSTDDTEIAEVSRAYGAGAIKRRADLAGDTTLDYPVIVDALMELNCCRWPDYVVQLRPTSPLRPHGLIDEACFLCKPMNVSSVRSVTPASQTPFKMWEWTEDGILKPIIAAGYMPEMYNQPRQLLPQAFWQTGHVDVVTQHTLDKLESMTGDRPAPLFMDRRYCVDIDTPEDLAEAERRLESLRDTLDWPRRVDG